MPPLLTVWSTPWSKNWPKNVNQRVVRRREADVGGHVGDEERLVRRHAGRAPVVRVRRRVRVRSCTARPAWPCVRTGKLAAATAAGFVEVWSTIRLLMVRGCESTTLPFSDLYDVGPGGPTAPRPGVRILGVAEHRRLGQPRELLVGRGEPLASREQVVARAVDGPQAVRRSGGPGSGPGRSRRACRTGW